MHTVCKDGGEYVKVIIDFEFCDLKTAMEMAMFKAFASAVCCRSNWDSGRAIVGHK